MKELVDSISIAITGMLQENIAEIRFHGDRYSIDIPYKKGSDYRFIVWILDEDECTIQADLFNTHTRKDPSSFWHKDVFLENCKTIKERVDECILVLQKLIQFSTRITFKRGLFVSNFRLEYYDGSNWNQLHSCSLIRGPFDLFPLIKDRTHIYTAHSLATQ